MLHSFFISDLNEAKNIKSDNLDKYILSICKNRYNLDSRKESKFFNPELFSEILSPINYPIARFPSNPEFSLSLMQQIAVNLSVGFDNQQIRSVNGPPGTGKTTLLKDIFSQLIVKQAYEIASQSLEYIEGTDETRYYDKASIGCLPKKIAQNGIVVASSNHGAIQNIVNELPLIDGIYDEFRENILSVDYFKDISNLIGSSNTKEKSEGLKSEEIVETERFWGLLSMEGGKKDNMDNIVSTLESVVHYLEHDYELSTSVYADFLDLYNMVVSKKDKIYKNSCDIANAKKLKNQIEQETQDFKRQLEIKEKMLEMNCSEGNCNLNLIHDDLEKNRRDIDNYNLQLSSLEDEKCEIKGLIYDLRHTLLSSFNIIKNLREYKNNIRICNERLHKIAVDKIIIVNKRDDSKQKIHKLENDYEKNLTSLKTKKIEFDNWKYSEESKIEKLKSELDVASKKINGIEIDELTFDIDYDSLQLSNPWFDSEYRRLQSLLFIKSLEVRKEFLYRNIKNIKASANIWRHKKNYRDKKIIVCEAWNWMNFTIPIIGSTFASFSRMCECMGVDTIGYLFIDEAGQAIPQASVGAILRSRNVLAVGDPSQIKPVLTLDSNILQMLGECYGVSDRYLSEDTSTQTLIDAVSQYGYYEDLSDEKWIGIPLWVHRRCKHPMFDISNKISYGDNMVQGIKKDGISKWYDVSGNANDKYVTEQGEFLKEKLQEMIVSNPDIVDESKNDIVFVITPFKNVAYKLTQLLKDIKFSRFDKSGRCTNIGTVHTFQGKEAPIVFFVLGADKNSIGAAKWAVGSENPNIMNVAATRAKKAFYIIGDKDLYESINSKVINETISIIDRFNRGN